MWLEQVGIYLTHTQGIAAQGWSAGFKDSWLCPPALPAKHRRRLLAAAQCWLAATTPDITLPFEAGRGKLKDEQVFAF